MDHPQDILGIASIIQLAVAPVFLLAGIGAILNVLALRLARVIDRARVLEAAFPTLDDEEKTRSRRELRTLDRRMRVVQGAISLCTTSALFVCVVVMVLFISNLLTLDFANTVAPLFILAMSLLIGGLVLFLVEIFLATKAIQVRREYLKTNEPMAPVKGQASRRQ
ncbi:hypothetical protein JCM17844_19160 [Iodidimonas gelatinilytica]|uniref:DUF2721 domain-containing protein n=1 Tax=Iodidimonas gelatinilytica TaxID=1236966 RepID=A0A5A7MYV6_9PROT|nr:DUF2721 domain-containing protein [Iodidimonas gelatinilytica]GEQ98279.1 hypothetical protein JCM17844_19160 [Iodidimonas gelatinilytica]GER00564.1 hypothetical protein JCM17845_11870 [Iodidimonas gelatinilytica]